ncbi:DUF7674 family protein [Mucilaginibacter jinjuensis]|uniref:DUF7674 domain-containing protein n=1 Tax=Mucilaginibacter jinjuensis TaxID=1176721 RepID=A0ABY7T311_9SPHI|nr:hypothetical protein [Mucilaginibacter jinjuensis]WCT10771.1 hypothetical protein PQO05_18710 [Mucilaginibacter jinjuensis]
MNAESFVFQLITEFPELKEDILDEELTSLQIMSFRAFTQKAIDVNDLELVKRCLTFVDGVLDAVDPEINNSLYLSYLGKLNFKNNSHALNLLPVKLSKAISELNKAYAESSKNDQANNFIKNLDKGQS